jgi:radical SAM protein with 4Fe4S-binding SPASM domain
MLDEIIDLLDTFDIILWSVFFLVPTGRLSEIDLISAEEFEQVFDKLYQTSQRVLFDINSTDAQHYGRYLLQHCTEARRLSEQPAHTYNRMPQFSQSLVGIDSPDGIGCAPCGSNDGKGFVFISHLGKVYPSGFLPLSGGNVCRQSLSDIYRNSPLFRKLCDSRNLEGKCGVCEHREICGGSRARSFAVTGDMFAEEACCVYEPKRPTACRDQSTRASV